jgi:tRNA G18 (ribose-2'-O)-methylase SpoU
VEGVLAIRALLASPYPVRSLLLTEARWTALVADLDRAAVAAPVFVADRGVLQAVAGFDIHRGAVASADRLPAPDPAALLAAAPERAVVAVVEAVNDHENLGGLFRNAAAFGVSAVFLDPTCADPLYRRSVRVSLGHVLGVSFTRLAAWPEDLAILRSAGFDIVALTPHSAAEPIERLATRPPHRVAVMVGAEGPGLSPDALAAANRTVRIPMAPGVDSLNVATAAAIAFHCLAAQRSR